jgi:hypothetical protein
MLTVRVSAFGKADQCVVAKAEVARARFGQEGNPVKREGSAPNTCNEEPLFGALHTSDDWFVTMPGGSGDGPKSGSRMAGTADDYSW